MTRFASRRFLVLGERDFLLFPTPVLLFAIIDEYTLLFTFEEVLKSTIVSRCIELFSVFSHGLCRGL